uniref:Uncharacterized protein n=1 Tax=Avena sativa TaxID=4498 RepID=A0ACD5XZG9_AVESA
MGVALDPTARRASRGPAWSAASPRGHRGGAASPAAGSPAWSACSPLLRAFTASRPRWLRGPRVGGPASEACASCSPPAAVWRRVGKPARWLRPLPPPHVPTRGAAAWPAGGREAAALVAGIHRAAAAAGDGAVQLRGLLYEYSNAVVTRAVTGAAGATAETIKRLLGNTAAFMSGFQAEDVMPDAAAKVVRWATGFEKKLDREVEAWDEFLSEIVAEHMEKKGDGGPGEEDFLDVLLRLREEGAAGFELTDDYIKSIVKDMIAAGTETSSVTLEWAMAELVGNPRAMAKLQDEITRATGDNGTIEEDTLNNTEYLKAVSKEALRLHPPAPLLIPHESTAAAVVQGYEIPPKTALFINAWAIGRDPAAWGDAAEEFRPERFLGGGSAADVDMRGNDYELLPFGAGRRLCPGISFALPVLEVALANLVRHFDWELLAGTRLDMSEAPGLTTPPLAPLRLVPKCRALV